MKFKSICSPSMDPGIRISGKKAVVPDQAMSLQEILTRFTRNEQLPIGKNAQYDDGDHDLEKVQHGDLVDRAEFVEEMREIHKSYDRQEKAKAKAAREKIAAELKAEVKAEAKAEAEKRAGEARKAE